MVCNPAEEGSLGIRSFADVVEAFELKLWWHFREQHSLWASYMKSKYCRATHPSMVQFQTPNSPL